MAVMLLMITIIGIPFAIWICICASKETYQKLYHLQNYLKEKNEHLHHKGVHWGMITRQLWLHLCIDFPNNYRIGGGL